MNSKFKYSLVLCMGFFSLIDFAMPAFAEVSKKKFEFKLTGGFTYMVIGDLNDHLVDWNKTRRRSIEGAGGTILKESQPLHWGGEFIGELLYNFDNSFTVSIGIGYIRGSHTDSAETLLDTVTGKNDHDTRVSAVPVRIGGVYSIPISNKTRISLGTGLGYYCSKFEKFYRREPGDGYWINSDFSGKGGGLGFDGTIGFEYSVSNNIALVVEGQGRYAKVSGISGSRDRIDSNGWSDSIVGDYYTLEREREPGIWSRVFNIAEEAPSGEGIRNVRDGVIDLSGFTIRIGLKIGLF